MSGKNRGGHKEKWVQNTEKGNATFTEESKKVIRMGRTIPTQSRKGIRSLCLYFFSLNMKKK